MPKWDTVVQGAIFSTSKLSIDNSDLTGTTYTWSPRATTGTLEYKNSNGARPSYVDINIVGLENGDQLLVYWSPFGYVVPPYFLVDGNGANVRRAGPVAWPDRHTQTLFRLQYLDGVLFVEGHTVPRSVAPTVLKQLSGRALSSAYSPVDFRNVADLSAGSPPTRDGIEYAGICMFPSATGWLLTYDLSNWTQFIPPVVAVQGKDVNLIKLDGSNQAYVIPESGGLNTIYTLRNRDLTNSANWIAQSTGTDDRLIGPRVVSGVTAYLLARDDEYCYRYDGNGPLTQLGLVQGWGTSSESGIAQSNADDTVVAVVRGSVYASTDSGVTWAEVLPAMYATARAVAYNPRMGVFVVGGTPNVGFSPVYYSRDAVTWYAGSPVVGALIPEPTRLFAKGEFFFAAGHANTTTAGFDPPVINSQPMLWWSRDAVSWHPVPGTLVADPTVNVAVSGREFLAVHSSQADTWHVSGTFDGTTNYFESPL